jgi:hypothetical protein
MPLGDPGSHMDLLPTVMHFLGGPDAVPEGLDGQVFGFRDYVRSPPGQPSQCVIDSGTTTCKGESNTCYLI